MPSTFNLPGSVKCVLLAQDSILWRGFVVVVVVVVMMTIIIIIKASCQEGSP
jgi:hypothetical protein